MEVIITTRFKKQFEKLPTKIKNQFQQRLEIFLNKPDYSILQTHRLKGNLIGLRAFSVTGDYRVIYQMINLNTIKLVNIGTHSQLF